jgi:hypothetical protein
MKREILLNVETQGRLIRGVPHVSEELDRVGFEFTVRSSVQSKVGEIYEYMIKSGMVVFDYQDYEKIKEVSAE